LRTNLKSARKIECKAQITIIPYWLYPEYQIDSSGQFKVSHLQIINKTSTTYTNCSRRNTNSKREEIISYTSIKSHYRNVRNFKLDFVVIKAFFICYGTFEM